MDEAMAWFDHYLKGLPLKRFPTVEVQDNEGKWRTEAQWPPADGSYYSLPIKAGTYQDDRSNTAASGIGTWTFTQPAPYDMHFAGVPKLTLEVDTQVPRANLVALIYDVDPKGSARMITESAYLLREEGKISFELYPQDWKLEKGHRIGILLSGSDNAWYLHIPTRTEVSVLKGSLSLPFLRFERTPNVAGDIADAMLKVPVINGVAKDMIADRTLKAKFPPPLQHR